MAPSADNNTSSHPDAPVHTQIAIVGAGVAGLVLANMLDQLHISYYVLESYSSIAPPSAASFGLMPNGLRILDQIGVYEKLQEFFVPHDHYEHRDGDDGSLYAVLTTARYLTPLLGYTSHAVSRQVLLKVLYDNLSDESRVRPASKVARIENLETKAVVTTEDGFKVVCDIVAGADGVHSLVRQEINAFAGVKEISPNYLASRSACVFGFSNPVLGITGGQFYNIYRKDVGIFILTGQGDTTYWFLTQDFETPIKYGEVPKYTQQYMESLCEEAKDVVITPGVTFGDLYKNRREIRVLPLEEGVAETWHAGRMFLLGDSCHKMVPQRAQGGNQAIESAACFVNHFRPLQTHHRPSIPLHHLNTALERYTDQRRSLATEMMKSSSWLRDALVKRGAFVDGYLRGMTQANPWDGLHKLAEPMSRCSGLEDWHRTTERTLFYEKQAKRLAEGQSVREVIEGGHKLE